MAEGLFKKMIEKSEKKDDINVLSAGISAGFGPPHPLAIKAMEEFDVDISSQRAMQFTKKMANEADLILTLDLFVKNSIIEDFPKAYDKVYTLKEFVFSKELINSDFDVEDPYGGPKEAFKRCAADIAEVLEVLVGMI